MRNVEIKAAARNVAKLIETAAKLSASDGEIIKQVDTFFKTPQGRLKLRKFEVKCLIEKHNRTGELLYYERPDVSGPKTCSYQKVPLSDNADGMHDLLSAALGQIVVVKKVRRLFLVGQTRIHVDAVEGLGDFVELEVVLRDDQSSEDGERIAEGLMKELDVGKDDLVACAYADLLLNK